jgi:hypothetical protein
VDDPVPKGRLKIGRDAILGNFQPSLRDSIMAHDVLHIQPAVFQAPDKAVILSEAHRRAIANSGPDGAKSKDPGDGHWQMLLGAFRPQTNTGR